MFGGSPSALMWSLNGIKYQKQALHFLFGILFRLMFRPLKCGFLVMNHKTNIGLLSEY